ncbi:MAG: PKD domain-containing protein, partial [Cytophagaceae bacterium]
MLYRFLHIVIISLLFLPVCGYGQTPSSPDSTVYKIKFLPVNTTTSDYCAVPYHNGIVFCSARKSINGVSYYSERSQNSMSHLYYSEYLTHSRLSKPKAFAKTFSSKYNEGPVCFDDNFSTIFFTTNINPTVKLQDQKKDLYTLKIFKAKMVNNEWVNVQGLPFNSDRYNVGHPSLSHDGTKLFFISDMPGGYGGTDLYMVINNEGSWSKPINLGPGVNTRGNEMFPFMGHDGRLYFSSDGHPGYGKLDVFTAELINGKWGLTKNLGEPINSNDDDFGFYLEKNGFTGYFTSNRSGGIDNIYRYERMNKSCETVPDIDFCFTFFEKNAIFGEDLPMAYEWNLGDGTKKRGSEISHCFDKSGKYKIQLNIIDSITGVIFYNEATYSITVNEINRPYIEIIGGTASGKTMELDAARSVLAHCKIQDYLWDFGDGYTALGERVVHKYPQEGSYEVYLNVSGISEITGGECNSCVKKRIEVKNAPIIADSASHVSSVAETLYNPNDKDDVVYKVQVTSSDTPISIDSDQFKVLDQEVTEFFDRGFYGYTVGDENDLLSAYPLFMDVREKGFEEARVVAFKDGKIVSGDDTTNLRKVQGTAVTFISSRIINRFGDPIPATLYLEDLTNGKRLAVFTSDSTFGRYEI